MMKRILLLLCIFISVSLVGQAPIFEWAVQMGGTLGDRGHSIATDTFGNVYTTGSFSNNAILSDTADFDSGPGFYGLFSNGDADIFVSKLSTDGDLLWAVSFGSDDGDRGYGITTDVSGNVFVTGTFRGWVDFDPGPEIYTLSSSPDYSDIFVLKLDTNGSLVWAKKMGGATHDFGRSIAVDNEGNVYTTGSFTTTADFDPGPDVFNITYNSNAQYQSDVFVSKLNSDGEFVWAKSIGGVNTEHGIDIILDNFNNVFVTGNFSDTVDFDPGTSEYNISAIGYHDLFLLKLSLDGEFIWAKNIGGALSATSVSGIGIDSIGNVYTTGNFDGVVDFDPGLGLNNLSSNGNDIFILKLSTDGEYIWAKSLGGGMSDGGSAIVVDEHNNVYTTGLFRSTVDFNPGLGSYNLSAIGGDAFVLKLNVEGSFVWAASLTGNDESDPFSFNIGESITLDKWDNIYTAGSFIDTIDFDPDTTNFNLVSYGTRDVFIQKMKQPCYTRDTTYLNYTSCDTFAIGIIEYIYPSQIGCDSIVIETTNLIPIPDTPITPADLTIQENQPPFQITIQEVPNATAYTWTVPSGAQILSGQGTNTITVNGGTLTTGGSICVSASNECGSSVTDCLQVTVDITDALKESPPKTYRIFPNPVTAILNITFTNNQYHEIVLIDISGRERRRVDITEDQMTLSTKELASGVYWLKIIGRNEVIWEAVEVVK